MLKNLDSLAKDMKKKNYYISAFVFNFLQKEYMVFVKRFRPGMIRHSNYARVVLEIIDADDSTHRLECEANKLRLIASDEEIREFLNEPPSTHPGNIALAFTRALGYAMPTSVRIFTTAEKKKMVSVFYDDDNADKIYCMRLKRNPEGQHRSEANTQKAKLLVPDLYERFRIDDTISFCFTADEEKDKSVNDILLDFARRRGEEK